ncbi:MAG: ShET2/EspL2 family type III secretion system effector toxin [Burkholderiales bacterium]|nr:ShET2/EspL2 family type III secretion system effector toxin [Burkholderiales bacterium]
MAPAAEPAVSGRPAAPSSSAVSNEIAPRGTDLAGPSAPRASLTPHQQALQAAANKGDLKGMQLLLRFGADPTEVKFPVGPSANGEVNELLRAAVRIRRLLPAAPRGPQDESPLMQALRCFNLPLARHLLDAETLVFLRPEDAWLPAAFASRHDVLTALLVLHGDDDLEARLQSKKSLTGLNNDLHVARPLPGAPELDAHLKQYPYYSHKLGRQAQSDLNGAAHFVGRDGDPQMPIVCRHLALAWLMQHEAAPGKPNYDALKNAEAIRQNIPAAMEDAYERVRDLSPEVRIGSNKEWGRFATDLFREMERSGASAKRMLIESGVHVMAAEFKIKSVPGQPPRYVVKVYDPSRTLVHKRTATDDLRRLEAHSLDQFLADAQAFGLYFGDVETVFLAIDVPAGVAASPPPRPPGGLVGRRIAGPLPPLDGVVLHHLLTGGFGGSLRDLKPAILALAHQDPDGGFELLNAMNVEGAPGLYQAVAENMAEAVAVFGEIVQSCPFEPVVKAQLLGARLLTEEHQGSTTISLGLRNGCTEATEALIDAIIGSDLPSEQCATMLAARFEGVPALAFGVERGHLGAARALMQAVATSTVLNSQQKESLLSARNAMGLPALSVALQRDDPSLVREFVKSIAAAGLPPEMQIKLLLAKDPVGEPCLIPAMASEHSAAIGSFVDAVLSAELPTPVKIGALRAEFQGRTALERATAQGCDVAVFRDAVMRSDLPPDDKARLLDDAPRRRRVE